MFDIDVSEFVAKDNSAEIDETIQEIKILEALTVGGLPVWIDRVFVEVTF